MHKRIITELEMHEQSDDLAKKIFNKKESEDSDFELSDNLEEFVFDFKIGEKEYSFNNEKIEKIGGMSVFIDRTAVNIKQYINDIIEANSDFLLDIREFTGDQRSYELVEFSLDDLDKVRKEVVLAMELLKNKFKKGDIKEKTVLSRLRKVLELVNNSVESKKCGDIEVEKKNFVKTILTAAQQEFKDLEKNDNINEGVGELEDFENKLKSRLSVVEFRADKEYMALVVKVSRFIKNISKFREFVASKKDDSENINTKKGEVRNEPIKGSNMEEEDVLTFDLSVAEELGEALEREEEKNKVENNEDVLEDEDEKEGSKEGESVSGNVESENNKDGIVDDLVDEDNEKGLDSEEEKEGDFGDKTDQKYGRGVKKSLNRYDRSLMVKKLNTKEEAKLFKKISKIENVDDLWSELGKIGRIKFENDEKIDLGKQVNFIQMIVDDTRRGNVIEESEIEQVTARLGIRRKLNDLLNAEVEQALNSKKKSVSENDSNDKDDNEIEEDEGKWRKFKEKTGELMKNDKVRKQIGLAILKTTRDVAGSVAGVRSLWTTVPFVKQWVGMKMNKRNVNKLFKNLDNKSEVDLGDAYKAEDSVNEVDKLKPGDVIDLKKFDKIEKRIDEMVKGGELSEEEADDYYEKLNNLIENYKEERESLIEGTNKELEDILNEYVKTKVEGAVAAREAVNTAMMASGLASSRWAAYGMMDIVARYKKINKEKGMEGAVDDFINLRGVAETFKEAGDLFKKKENRELGRVLTSIAATGKIARYALISLIGTVDVLGDSLNSFDKNLLSFGEEDVADRLKVNEERVQAEFEKVMAAKGPLEDFSDLSNPTPEVVTDEFADDPVGVDKPEETTVNNLKNGLTEEDLQVEIPTTPEQGDGIKQVFVASDLEGSRIIISERLESEGVSEEVAKAVAQDGVETEAEKTLIKKDISDELKISILKNEVSESDLEKIDYIESGELFGAKTIDGTRGSEELKERILKNIEVSGDVERSIATVYEGEGILHAFRRQLEASPEEFGFDNKGDVKDWSATKAYDIAEKAGYISENGQSEIRISRADHVAYSLKLNDNNLIVEEFEKDAEGLFLDKGTDKLVLDELSNPQEVEKLEQEIQNYEYPYSDEMPKANGNGDLSDEKVIDKQTPSRLDEAVQGFKADDVEGQKEFLTNLDDKIAEAEIDAEAEEKTYLEEVKQEALATQTETLKEEISSDKYDYSNAEVNTIVSGLGSDITERKTDFIENELMDSPDREFAINNLSNIFAVGDRLEGHSYEDVIAAYKDVPDGIHEYKVSFVKFLLNSSEDGVSREGIKEMFGVVSADGSTTLDVKLTNGYLTKIEGVKIGNSEEVFNILIDRTANPPRFGFEVPDGEDVATYGDWGAKKAGLEFSDKNIKEALGDLKEQFSKKN